MLGDILKQRRSEFKLTQQEVADQLYVTRQAVSNWETGKSYPDIPTLIEISNYYDLSLDYMLKGDERYMEKVKEDTEEFKLLKETKAVGYLMLFALVPLFILLGVTKENQETGLWRILYYLCCGLGFAATIYLMIKMTKHGETKVWFWGALLASMLINLLDDFIAIPYSGLLVFGLSVLAFIILFINVMRNLK